jgi:hypothetical protein
VSLAIFHLNLSDIPVESRIGKKNNPRKGPLPFEKWMLHNHNGQPVRDDNNTSVATTTIYEQRSHLRVVFASAT